jgi:hypothetical protein
VSEELTYHDARVTIGNPSWFRARGDEIDHILNWQALAASLHEEI